ncbi:M56 family metallopeptidase [[Muricauda] lutisoli]|uniref:M56 family metallopeptidase n=1 Tax=[Muricauda] lutisoli TaxID=2816035 RepID=A0ABS3EYV0_9FLAO|nr:M56 family metallopeptidase [[Muricauda] lutisoli]MBO0331298.1 M56 family metallopeptidase [[Muricauda] lutisoli]
MLVFLIKSTACLVIFLAFYKLVLEKESIHHFKRFFLLGALMASFLIPNIVFTEYVDISPNTVNVVSPTTGKISEIDTSRTLFGESIFDWNAVLWGIYALGVLAFGFRFVVHLIQIWSRIRSNTKLKENFITKVLLKQSLPPHTFFNYIFLNQQQFEEKNIPQEVLLHEETHAKQRHSLDILFIELAQVLLWFNPIIYLFKSAIKLNHEFLADRAVIVKNKDRSHYQNTILSYLSHDNFNKHQSIGIANAINYSSIKKRFTVMKTNTSNRSFVLRSFLLLPLTALLLFGFSEHRQIEREGSFEQIIKMNLLDNGSIALGNQNFHFNEIPKILNQDYLQSYDASETKVEITTFQPVHYNTLTNLSKVIRTTGIDLIEVVVEEVVMDKDQFKENVPITSATTLLNAKKMTVVDNKVQLQQSASREEMKEYNALAKKYNDMDHNNMVINKKEVMRLKVIYGKMSEKQRADAEPFPNFPPPPPAPSATRPPMPPSALKSVKEVKTTAPAVPPAPPAPPKPIEHIKKMVAKGASFTLNGKEISGKKAIEVVQKNQHINIDAREANGTNPVVKLSTEPIVIEN